MIARISLIALSLAMLAIAPVAAKDKTKSAGGETVTCEGVFGRKSSDALVRQTFGDENVETGTVYGVEGIELLATTVFPDDPQRRMQFTWWDEDKLEYLGSVELAPGQQTPEGVRIGQTVAEVEAINGAPFTINGFWWDYGGGAMFENGALKSPEEGCSFRLRFAPRDDYPESLDITPVAGEVQVPSSEPLLKELDVRVSEVSLGYPWPEELPQPEY